MCKCMVIFIAIACLAFSLSLKLQGLYSMLRIINDFLFIYDFVLFSHSLYYSFVRKGKEDAGDLLWIQWYNLVYYHVLYLLTKQTNASLLISLS